jgi:putative ABC transport system permease protein
MAFMEDTARDAQYAVRSFFKSKLFALVAILTLALGIGANTVIFSILNTVLLHPLAYPHPERLVAIASKNIASGVTIVSYTKFTLLQAQSRTLERIGAYYLLPLNVATQGAPEQVAAAHGNLDLFPLLGVTPALGRGFLPEEDQPGGRDVALLTDAFWRNHLGADPSIVGKSISLDGRNTTIIGVLPASFRFPFLQPEPQIWLPRVVENPNYSPERIRGGVSYLLLVARARPGQTIEQERAELDTIAARYRAEFPNLPDSQADLTVEPLESFLVSGVRSSLMALLGAVGFLLLIACANVANLLMARATSREKEFGIRRALGATRGRLVRQLLTESLALSFMGGGLGVLLAALSLRPLMSIVRRGTIPLSDSIHMDASVLWLSLAVSCLTGIVFGLIPAMDGSKRALNEKLKDATRGSTVNRGRMRQALVVSEIALTLMLVTGAGLLIRSVVNLMRVDLGFVPGGVMTFFVSLPATQYPRPDQRREFSRRLVEQAAALPGVESAAVVSHLPLAGGGRFIFFCPEGTVCQGVGKDPLSAWRQVSPDFFTTMRTPVLRGRVFDDRDRSDSTAVVIINQAIADRYFPGVNPVGRHIAYSRDRSQMEVVGVVADVKFSAVNSPDAEELYVPYTQNPWPSITLAVRSSPSGSGSLVAAIRQTVSRLDPDLPVAQIQSMDDLVSTSIAQPRLIAGLVGGFAAAALFLAAVGIYGVMAYLVTQRSQEIAIRMALGAQRWMVFRLVASQGMRLVALGLAIGFTISMVTTRLISTLLFRTSPTDSGTMAGGALLFVVVAFFACYIPSRRAMRVDVVASLRSLG